MQLTPENLRIVVCDGRAPFKHCGKNVELAVDYAIAISMAGYIDAMDVVTMSTAAARHFKALAADDERSFAESAI